MQGINEENNEPETLYLHELSEENLYKEGYSAEPLLNFPNSGI